MLPPHPTWDARRPTQAGGCPLPRAERPPLSSPTCHHLGTGPHSSELVVAGWLAGLPCPPERPGRVPPVQRLQGPPPALGHLPCRQPALFPQQRKKTGRGRGAACEESVSPHHHITREHHRSRLLTFLEVKQGWWSGQASLGTMARGPGHSHSPNDHQAPGAGGWKCTLRLCQGPPPTSGVSQAPLLSRQALSRKGSGSFTSIPVTCWKLVTPGR